MSPTSGLTMAEYFRDVKNQDVLLFIDNIFRFAQAGSEVSSPAGPYAVRSGLPADAGQRDGRLQERITSTREAPSPRCRPFTCRPMT